MVQLFKSANKIKCLEKTILWILLKQMLPWNMHKMYT